MTIKNNAWWLSPALTLILAVVGGLFTWQTIIGDMQSELVRLQTRVNVIDNERDSMKKDVEEIRKRVDQIYLLLAGR